MISSIAEGEVTYDLKKYVKELHTWLIAGHITDDEFQQLKNKLVYECGVKSVESRRWMTLNWLVLG